MPATPSFEEMFGVGKVPIASYFNLPKGASADTQFSPQARELLSQGEDYAREQAAREAEIAAEELLGGAANMSDDQLQQQLVQNPRLFGTRAIQPLSGYVQYRQSTSPMSDEVLGPVIESKITDPYHKERFRNRMLDEGLSANDAYDAYLTDEYNNKFEVALAEAGVPETEYAKLRTASGKFDPVAVPRAVAAAKAAAKLSGTGKKAEPIDIRIETLKEALEERKKRLEARGEDLTKDERYQKLADELDTVYDEKLVGVRPPVTPISAANQPGPDGVIRRVAPGRVNPPNIPVAIEDDSNIVPEERSRLRQEQAVKDKEIKEQEAIDLEISKAWTNQKKIIQEELLDFYPKKDLIAVAKGVLSEKSVLNPVDVSGRSLISYPLLVLQKIQRPPNTSTFKEPQNKRWGTQNVTNTELLREWAEQYLAENGGQKAASVPTSTTSEPLTELIPP